MKFNDNPGPVPEGYTIVTEGYVQIGDRLWHGTNGGFYGNPIKNVCGDHVSYFMRVVRPIALIKDSVSCPNWKKMPDTFGFYFFYA